MSRWSIGRCLVFDDSFIHHAWHNGTATESDRFVLIVDIWHPGLSTWQQRWQSVHIPARRQRLVALAEAAGITINTAGSGSGDALKHLHSPDHATLK